MRKVGTIMVVVALLAVAPAIGGTPAGAKGPSPSPTPTPTPTPTPSPTVSPSPSPVPPPGTGIGFLNLTSGVFAKAGSTTEITTQSVTLAPNSLGLLHVMTCCFGGAPTVTSPGLSWELVVTHLAGEKRHWVYRAAAVAGTSGPLRMQFPTPQGRAMWIVDGVSGAALGRNGADAIVQTAFQESQQNASSGAIALAPFESPLNAAVGFALCGSGPATNIVPEAGYVETAEAETPGSSLLIDTFYRVGEDAALQADFRRDSDNSLQVESWLFLAIELAAA
jgi:hypothetical protein